MNQKGFTPVAIILVVVAIAVAGFAGWYVWDKNQNNTDKNTSPTSTPNTDVKETGTQNESQETTQKIFVFKELGISIQLPTGLEDLSYKYNSELGVAYVSVPSFTTANEKCYGQNFSDNSQASFGAISKVPGTYPVNPTEDQLPLDPLIKQFDTFYISGNRPNGITACTVQGVDENLVNDESIKLFKLLTEAVKQAEQV